MGIMDEYEAYRPAAQALDKENRMCIVLGHEDKLKAAFKRIEQIEKEYREFRLEMGAELAKRDELFKKLVERSQKKFAELAGKPE